MAGKSGLSNQLLGKLIVPKPAFGDPTDVKGNFPNVRIWADLKPNLSGEFIATIDAVWTDQQMVLALVHDVHGNIATVLLTQVNLK